MITRDFVAASAFVATALAISAPAQAIGFSGNGHSVIVLGTGAFFDSAIPNGTFEDTITFDTPASGLQNVNLTYFKLSQGLSDLQAWFNGEAISFSQTAPASFSGALSTTVSQGPQTLVIRGYSQGAGSYSGNVIFSSAVPEVATWLMMIAGIGFTGAALRRRQTRPQVRFAF